MRTPLAVAALAFVIAACSRADSWIAPTLKVVASPDGTALLRIVPGRSDQERGRAIATVLKYDASSGGYEKAVEFRLRNPSSPHAAVITNDARFIVTFDDWAGIGRTENVVVVYRGTGEFVRAWALSDIFTDDERKRFISSTSSTWWRGDVELLENRVQSPIVIIRPETQMAQLEKDRKAGPTVLFDVVKMTFERR